MFQKLSALLTLSLIAVMLTGCGSASYTTVTIQLRDKVTGEPVPFANINVYATAHSGETPPRGAIASTNTNGVAVVPVADGYTNYFEVYMRGHSTRPLPYEDASNLGYRMGWRDSAINQFDGRIVQMKIASPQEALALQQLPERSIPAGTPEDVVVIEPTPIDPNAQEDIDRRPVVKEKVETQPETTNTPTTTQDQPEFVEDEKAPDFEPKLNESKPRGGIPDEMKKPEAQPEEKKEEIDWTT